MTVFPNVGLNMRAWSLKPLILLTNTNYTYFLSSTFDFSTQSLKFPYFHIKNYSYALHIHFKSPTGILRLLCKFLSTFGLNLRLLYQNLAFLSKVDFDH